MRDAQSRMSKAASSSTEERVKVYKYIRSKLKPVFRHFFTEKHKNPMAWFATRLRYTRSVATTSIVGHVLGLGDRHTSNILMDNSTGEVVHIDLGIAFDQVRIDVVLSLGNCERCSTCRVGYFLSRSSSHSASLATLSTGWVFRELRECSSAVLKRRCECSVKGPTLL